MSFEDSSRDDWPCGRCTHLFSAHDPQGCHPVPGKHECNCGITTYSLPVPPPEPKGSASSSPDERCPHIREGGCCSGPGYCCHACEAPADAETAGEPEAPEHSVFEREGDCVAHGGTEPPRRSPYAVAYELQDGSAFEVALPGDATVRADDGLLIIHHAQSPVKGLVQVKPWGDQ